jgi:DNA ligase-1
VSAIKKPMLAGKCECLEGLRFPVLATPKLDGIRCLKIDGQALTRSFKPISNKFAREWIEANLPDGVDGELMLRGGTFSQTTSAIGSRDGEPDFVFHVFDYVSEDTDVPYACRVRELERLPEWERVAKVLPVEIKNADELAKFEEKCLAEGYEGVMVRDPAGPYKCGRSTEGEGWLLKIKRFADAEAEVLEPYEGMSNQNEAERDAFGRTKRSLAKAGMVGRGELGGFIVRALGPGEFVAQEGGPCRTVGQVPPPTKRGQGSAPISEVSGLPRSLGPLNGGRVTNHANMKTARKMVKNMVIKTDGLSAAARERTRGL